MKTIKKIVTARYFYGALLVLAVLLRLLLSKALMLYFMPGSQYDDLLQIHKAMAVSAGFWLGGYGPLTLVKGVGFPLLTALFHSLHLPYILAYHLLYVGACVLFIAAIKPVAKQKWLRFAVFVFMLFNPIAFSAQITRLYRDIGYYALALYCIAAALGFLLRCNTPKGGPGYIALCGFALALAATTREDSHWLYIYAAACLLAYLVLRFVVYKKQWKKLVAAPLLLVLGYCLFVLPICGINYHQYGVFTTDTYTRGPYAEAYGALSRINNPQQDPHIAIAKEQRMQLYALSPAFAELQEVLDGEDSPYQVWVQVQGEYKTGYFSLIFREAVADIGYTTARTANEYYTRLANEVNAVCDAGLIPAGPRRSGITARYYPWMLGPVAAATWQGMQLTMQCHGISPLPVPVDADDAYLLTYEEYVHDTIAANRYMPTGEEMPNYQFTGPRLWLQWGARLVVSAYRHALAPLFYLSVVLYIYSALYVLYKKKSSLGFWCSWVACGSLLCAFVLRCAMIGFVHISSFEAINNPAYQAGSYTALLAFIAFAGIVAVQTFGPAVKQVLSKKKQQAGAVAPNKLA